MGGWSTSCKEWLYEVKFDGYRCLAGRDSTGVTLWSRSGKPEGKVCDEL
jgi:ATP-dependent DNA ligase